jgi:RNA polymerase sigma factor (sigma-70 family)
MILEQEKEFRQKTGIEFTDFYKKFKDKLLWYLKQQCKNDILAHEVADETMLKALEEVSKYDPQKAQFSTWLFRIARNHLIHTLKERKRIDMYDGDFMNGEKYITENDFNVEQEKEITERKVSMIRVAINELPEKYSIVLNMREVDGLAYDEISSFLGENISTVKSRIRNGRIRLRKMLEEDFKHLDSHGVSC